MITIHYYFNTDAFSLGVSGVLGREGSMCGSSYPFRVLDHVFTSVCVLSVVGFLPF